MNGSLEDVAALLRREIAVDPTFAPFVRACRAGSIPVTVVSSGIDPIVRGRLEDAGVEGVTVVANGIDVAPHGWSIKFRDPVDNGTDKAGLVRAARSDGRRTVFIGDGPSDYDAARAADRCFAKSGSALERFLAERGIAATSFASFDEIRFPSLRSCLEDR